MRFRSRSTLRRQTQGQGVVMICLVILILPPGSSPSLGYYVQPNVKNFQIQ